MDIFRVAKSEEKCIEIEDEVSAAGEKMAIIRDGVASAELVPALGKKEKQPKSILGAIKDSIVMCDDLVEPVDDEWEV